MLSERITQKEMVSRNNRPISREACRMFSPPDRQGRFSPFEMNVQLSNVINDIVGETELHIVEAIIGGERDPEQLASLCSSRIKIELPIPYDFVPKVPRTAKARSEQNIVA